MKRKKYVILQPENPEPMKGTQKQIVQFIIIMNIQVPPKPLKLSNFYRTGTIHFN